MFSPLAAEAPPAPGVASSGALPLVAGIPPGMVSAAPPMPPNLFALTPITFTLTMHSTIQKNVTPIVTRVNKSPALVPKAL